MALRAAYTHYNLHFKFPATTSRETMRHKETYFIKLWMEANPEVYGIGECAIFRGLSAEDTPQYAQQLHEYCLNINRQGKEHTEIGSSIKFGVETATLDLSFGGRRTPFPSPWVNGQRDIDINGLVWMGTIEEMQQRIGEKLSQGFNCIKIKIGGQDFDQECALLEGIRSKYSTKEIQLRLDANGAFTADNALERLGLLSKFDIHSIEQPIKPHQWEVMAEICQQSPIPIALDEELIGMSTPEYRVELLTQIKPQYIILKPSLCGGFSGAEGWICAAKSMGIGWWITSALESNIGLNAIAQWTAKLGVTIPQGLGTGALYTNNIQSPLTLNGSKLSYDPEIRWEIPHLEWIEPR